jgi:hypothetical protein
MIEFGLGFLAICGAQSGLLAWFLTRRQWRRSKAAIVLLSALPVPVIAVIVGIGSIVYGISIKGTCGYDDCGGFIFLGILSISAAIMAYCVGLIFGVIGAIIGRSIGRPVSEARD